MSFIIAVHVNEGIVIASDRRTTYSNTNVQNNIITKQLGIHYTDSTDKTFLCPNGCGISTCGESSISGKPIAGYIKEVIRTKIGSNCNVIDIPQIIIDHFNSFEEVPDTNFLVGGYDKSDEIIRQVLYKFNVKQKNVRLIETSSQGATWDGETSTLTRLIQNVALKEDNGEYKDLPYECILWNYFTLQDAVDFARYAVETTIKTMHFKNVLETVGGHVDILIITPDDSYWLQKENLH